MNDKWVHNRPEKTEYFEFYDRYVSLVPDGNIIAILKEQLHTTLDLLWVVPAEKADYRYAPGKWTLKEVVGHVIDIEWVFAYRALSFARCESPPLPGIDEGEFMSGANHSSRELPDLLDELKHLRSAVILLFDSFDGTIMDRSGIASDCRFTVRSIPHIIAGHHKHHMDVLRERYLV